MIPETYEREQRGDVESFNQLNDINPLAQFEDISEIALPPLSCLPFWDISKTKESKMFLTQLRPPSKRTTKKFRRIAKDYLNNLGIDKLYIPSTTACTKVGPNLYADGPITKKDHEEHEFSLAGPFIYKRFMATNEASREVWIPSRAYKTCSTWWTNVFGGVLRKDDKLILDETDDELVAQVCRNYVTSKNLDLKGCGLQYPREYIIILMEVLEELFPSEKLKEMISVAKSLFAKIEIQMEDGTFTTTKRGVGLGYFSTLMTICSRIMLQDVRIISMFSDDMLVDERDFNKARSYLESFDMVISSSDKIGHRREFCPVFGGLMISVPHKKGILVNQIGSDVNAALSKRYHWIRKEVINQIDDAWFPFLSFDYERIFGHEFFKGESMSHPINLGSNPLAIEERGIVKCRPVRDYTRQKIYKDDLMHYLPYHDCNKEELKEIHFKRKRIYESNLYLNSIHEDYLNPTYELIESDPLPKEKSAKVPLWLDLRQAREGMTSGVATCGLSPVDILISRRLYSYLDNPLEGMSNRGVYVSKYAYERTPIITKEKGDMIDMLYISSHNFVTSIVRKEEQKSELPILDDSEDKDEAGYNPDVQDTSNDSYSPEIQEEYLAVVDSFLEEDTSEEDTSNPDYKEFEDFEYSALIEDIMEE